MPLSDADKEDQDYIDRALIHYVQAGDYFQSRDFLLDGANVHYQDDEALRIAVETKEEDITLMLLIWEADVHARDNEIWKMAAVTDEPGLLRSMISYAKDIRAGDDCAIRAAAEAEKHENVEILLYNGANPYCLSREQQQYYAEPIAKTRDHRKFIEGKRREEFYGTTPERHKALRKYVRGPKP